MGNRRDFLKTGTFAALGLSLPFRGESALWEANYKKLSAFGIQLWTVREDLGKDAKATLKKLSEYGYKQIESFEGRGGMFWGLGHTGFKSYMDELGMKIISSHCDYTKDFERKAAEAAEIGMKYLICPYKGPQKSIDDFKRFADEFNKAGETCKKNGIRFAYHNHDYSFKPINGEVPQDVMMKGTDKDLVDFEMDIYWVVAAGEDPKAWFRKYPHRFKLCHVKDLGKTAKGHESVHLGKGTIDFKSILKAGKDKGLKYYIVEQEVFTGSNPLDSAMEDAKYMKALSI
ncbi:sugar phosphate isomerase/epimerase family protein [Sediminibacterium soli]|uniref:sugar phosphate isomerase/epimerase family protein n=1 Tax=Sediminibacterium soli TaxID=2698829 RepID=UPI00137B76AC|nr:sugar phosphate isomerase/epimerase [Sediminibacterium soli]NCI47775.1 sugar phosphate isomerase/epimerase [Sediminibacterium soli]